MQGCRAAAVLTPSANTLLLGSCSSNINPVRKRAAKLDFGTTCGNLHTSAVTTHHLSNTDTRSTSENGYTPGRNINVSNSLCASKAASASLLVSKYLRRYDANE